MATCKTGWSRRVRLESRQINIPDYPRNPVGPHDKPLKPTPNHPQKAPKPNLTLVGIPRQQVRARHPMKFRKQRNYHPQLPPKLCTI